MTYSFRLTVRKEASSLDLLKDGSVVATRGWGESRDMGQRLFVSIAEVLTEHGLKPEEVGEFTIDSEVPDNYTSMRIAETVKKVYTYAVTEKISKKE